MLWDIFINTVKNAHVSIIIYLEHCSLTTSHSDASRTEDVLHIKLLGSVQWLSSLSLVVDQGQVLALALSCPWGFVVPRAKPQR